MGEGKMHCFAIFICGKLARIGVCLFLDLKRCTFTSGLYGITTLSQEMIALLVSLASLRCDQNG